MAKSRSRTQLDSGAEGLVLSLLKLWVEKCCVTSESSQRREDRPGNEQL